MPNNTFTFPQTIIVYQILGQLIVAERLEDVPDTAETIAMYEFTSIGRFRREVRFDKIEQEENS